jgi:hypothetical protein
MNGNRNSKEKGLPQSNLLYFIIYSVIFGLVAVNVGVNLIWLESFAVGLKERSVNYLVSEADRFAKDIEDFVETKIGETERLSQDIAISGNADFFVSRFLKENPVIGEVSIINLNGREEMRSSRREYFGKEDLRNLSLLEGFKEAGQGKTFVSKVGFTAEGEPYLTIAVPVRKLETEQAEAVLLSTLFLKDVWGQALEVRIGETGRISLIDDTGMLIADPNPARVLTDTNLSNLPPAESIIDEKTFSGGNYLNEKNVEVFGVGIPIKSLNWGIIVEQNLSEIEAPFRQVQTLTFIFLAAGLVITGVLIWLSLILVKGSRELAGRYDTISEQSKKLEEAKASLEIRINARTRELRELAERLEKENKERTKELQEKVQDLERFNRMAVGRELKMIELKEKIKKLRQQLTGK